MSKRKWLLTAMAGFIFNSVIHAQTQMVYDTIPFEIIQDKFIFNAKIDGKPVRMILDTGGQNIIVSDSADYYGVNILKEQSLADVNDTRIQARLGSVKNFRIGKWMNWDVGKVTVVSNNQFFRDLGIVGAVGGEVFANVCLSIDKKNRRFTISYPYRPDKIPRSEGTPIESTTFHAVVPVSIGNESVNVLFDTGMSGFLSLSSKDYEKISHSGNVERQHEGYGILYVGVSGIKNAVRDSIYKVRIPEMTIPGGKKFQNVGSVVGQHSTTIAGQKIFDYGIVMLDYPRGLFYFFPYDKTPADTEQETRVWNVRILPISDHFEVVATIGETELQSGDRVWEINGTDMSSQKLSESLVENLLNSTGKDTADITIGPDKKQLRKVVIRKI